MQNYVKDSATTCISMRPNILKRNNVALHKSIAKISPKSSKLFLITSIVWAKDHNGIYDISMIRQITMVRLSQSIH